MSQNPTKASINRIKLNLLVFPKGNHQGDYRKNTYLQETTNNVIIKRI